MTTYRIAFVGTGPAPESPDASGFAMAYRHAMAYDSRNDCKLVACADIVRENGDAFADSFAISDSNVYESYETMLEETEPDIVSVCVPPAIHADIVVGCIQTGIPDAIHCEKPMADTWGDCRRMVTEASEGNVQLTFNHQRRFGGPFRKAKALLNDGAIGELQRVEFSASTLFDYGSHSFDLSNFYVDESDPKWVLAQIDYSEENIFFGAHNENQALVQWEYESGVHGLAVTGTGSGAQLVDCHNRLIGSDGTIEIGVGFGGGEPGPVLRVRRTGSTGWETIDTDEDVHGAKDVTSLEKDQVFLRRAVADVVESLSSDESSDLSGENALRATKLIFGAWESARRRGRIEFPLSFDDNPLVAMVESGALTPEPASD
ncbi:Gfo/Idh/MocA family protein [Haladaptatus caseinilyticus]|uniref:Gfo/Idh/MocA family protein n=1 Tax=Haladaptatus caseinilyticus TaxID=2993314 RepID=UPI00224AA302|nr:Gfo/Idh/MocA family oxidoreductase [Haladaptatus caseinilyticus]